MENRSLKIRIAKASDYSACLPLFITLHRGDIGPSFKVIFEDYVNREDGLVLIAEQADSVIGILAGSYHLDIDWEGNTAKIDAIIVDERFRRKGIGTRLAEYFTRKAKNDDCKAVKSRINTKNVIAQSFHESLGFVRANTYEYYLDFHEQHE